MFVSEHRTIDAGLLGGTVKVIAEVTLLMVAAAVVVTAGVVVVVTTGGVLDFFRVPTSTEI